MATLDAEFFNDLGRVQLTVGDLQPGITYRIERNTADNPTWVPVRGAQNVTSTGATSYNDYEYVPNVQNNYRLLAPSFFDSFNREHPLASALVLPGESGAYASTPDHVSLDLTTELDIRVTADLDSWTPDNQLGLLGKWVFTGNQRSYLFSLGIDGTLRFNVSPDGSTNLTFSANDNVPQDKRILTVRVTFLGDNGMGNSEIEFFYDDNGSWVQTGSTVLGPVGSIFVGTGEVEVGSWNNGQMGLNPGNILSAEVRSTIGGTIVANPDFTAQTPGTTSFNDSTGKTWTVNGTAEIAEILDTTQAEWGVADTGQAWNPTIVGSETTAWVDNGFGYIRDDEPVGNAIRFLSDPIPGAANAEITYAAQAPAGALDVTVEMNVGLRAVSGDDYYEGLIAFRHDGFSLSRALEIRIGKFISGTFMPLTSAVLITQWSPGDIYRGRFHVEGDRLMFKVWSNTQEEPPGWILETQDSDITVGERISVRVRKGSGSAQTFVFPGPIELNTIPPDVDAIASVTPVQEDTFLKSITFPALNKALDCVDWEEQSRDARNGFFDVKGRHNRIGIWDVGSSASFDLTFITRSQAENRAVVALLSFGGVLFLQPPGDDENLECNLNYSGIPGGYVLPNSEYSQVHAVRGQAIWQWNVVFTKVAPPSGEVTPSMMTWQALWNIIGSNGTWQDVWDMWDTWEQVWATQPSIEQLGFQ